MKRLLTLALSALMCALAATAQDFTDHLTTSSQGQGSVSLHQDPAISDMVNGKKQFVSEKRDEKKESTNVPSAQKGKKTKARGYRIQVYWGGSSRTDQSNAQRAGHRITSAFPELGTYTTFQSPNWRCRVGDFVTHEEAAEYLAKIKEAHLGQGAIIVKSEVFIYQ